MLYACDAASGKLEWELETGGQVAGVFALDPSRLDELLARVAAEPTDSPTVVKLEKDHLVVGGVRVKRKS